MGRRLKAWCGVSPVSLSLSLDSACLAGARQAPPIWHDAAHDRLGHSLFFVLFGCLPTARHGSKVALASCPAFLPWWIDVGRPSASAPAFRLLGECLLDTGSPATTRDRELGGVCDVSRLPTGSLEDGRTEGKYDVRPSGSMAE